MNTRTLAQKLKYLLSLMTLLIMAGCAKLPQESVTLNQEVSNGITEIHASNIRFVNQLFEIKKQQVDEYEQQAMDTFFAKIAAATRNPSAPPLDTKALNRIKDKIFAFRDRSNEAKADLDKAKVLVVEKLQNNYNLLLNANNSVTALLQSAVDVDKAKNEGYATINRLSNGKVDLMKIDAQLNAYLTEKLGPNAEKAGNLLAKIEKLLNKQEG